MLTEENQLVLEILQDGSTSISSILLSKYKELGINDQEMMLIIHLLYFQSKGNYFPAVSELERRMSITAEDIMKILQRLVRQDFIRIDEKKENETGILYEAYNLNPLYHKVGNLIVHQIENRQIKSRIDKEEKDLKNIFTIFEQEFGRPLSPMEIEMINTWLDQDHYSIDLISYALKEAVFSNKLNFRYIDKILFEWQKKNLKTVDQIRSHIQKFRQNQPTKKKNSEEDNKKLPAFEFYNWLEED